MARAMWNKRKLRRWIEENKEHISRSEYRPPTIGAKLENQVSMWTVAVPNLATPWNNTKEEVERTIQFVEYLNTLDEYVGMYPLAPYGTLLLFRSLNGAKRGRNLIEAYGVQVGKNITECFVDKKYAEGGAK